MSGFYEKERKRVLNLIQTAQKVYEDKRVVSEAAKAAIVSSIRAGWRIDVIKVQNTPEGEIITIKRNGQWEDYK